MTTRFTVLTKTLVDVFTDVVSLGDVVSYEIDATPWQEDNDTITSVTWDLEYGESGIASETLVAGVASAVVTFSQARSSLIGVTFNTATSKKKVWLRIRVKDLHPEPDDYGYAA